MVIPSLLRFLPTSKSGGTSRDENHENQDQGVSVVTKVWKVQRVHGTDQIKAKRKFKTNLKSCDGADAPIIKAEDKPAFAKNCTKNLNLAVALASANNKSAKVTPKKPEYDSVKENINLSLFIYLIQLIYPSLNIAAEDNWKSDSISRADATTYWVAAQPSRFIGIGRRHVASEVGFAPSAP